MSGEQIYKDTYSFQLLNTYGPLEIDKHQAAAKRYTDKKLNELTPLESRPNFEYTTAEPGRSQQDEWQRIYNMKNINEK
jgi:hypothetical protein